MSDDEIRDKELRDRLVRDLADPRGYHGLSIAERKHLARQLINYGWTHPEMDTK